MWLAGVDLAWNGEKNPSAIAVGELNGKKLRLDNIYGAVTGLDNIFNTIKENRYIEGIAIDASLIINNKTGFRECETELNKVYRSKWAGCHPTNQRLYPDAFSVKLSQLLLSEGFNYVFGKKWQIECYPHASIIEIFGLDKRLLYKKGSVSEKRNGQKILQEHILRLCNSNILELVIPEHQKELYLNPDIVNTLKGQQLKSNEDALDSIICLYTAALYALKYSGHSFGNARNGYVWVPDKQCVR